jgi:hypothetical protein
MLCASGTFYAARTKVSFADLFDARRLDADHWERRHGDHAREDRPMIRLAISPAALRRGAPRGRDIGLGPSTLRGRIILAPPLDLILAYHRGMRSWSCDVERVPPLAEKRLGLPQRRLPAGVLALPVSSRERPRKPYQDLAGR